jgi:hypothetical protein
MSVRIVVVSLQTWGREKHLDPSRMARKIAKTGLNIKIVLMSSKQRLLLAVSPTLSTILSRLPQSSAPVPCSPTALAIWPLQERLIL